MKLFLPVRQYYTTEKLIIGYFFVSILYAVQNLWEWIFELLGDN